MAQLVKVKGLKGKQNKKKWAKNIDVSALLEAKARAHDEELRAQYAPQLLLTDDNDRTRAPLAPDRFKPTHTPLPRKTYDNRPTRQLGLATVDDAWGGADEGRHRYQPTAVPAVIAPESGHSYNPREGDIDRLKDRVVDYEAVKPIPRKEKAPSELPVVAVRHRNKKKREAQLAARQREEAREFRQQLHNIRKIKQALEEKEIQVQEGIKTRKIQKERLVAEEATGRVRKGRKLGRKAYQFKEYLPAPEDKPESLSKAALSPELFRERFDSIYRRGIFEPRTVKVHANRRKHIKVKERAFIE